MVMKVIKGHTECIICNPLLYYTAWETIGYQYSGKNQLTVPLESRAAEAALPTN